jgi:hypothetical protein
MCYNLISSNYLRIIVSTTFRKDFPERPSMGSGAERRLRRGFQGTMFFTKSINGTLLQDRTILIISLFS